MSKFEIPAWAFFVVGAGVIILSLVIGIDKMAFFILVGAIFILYGFIKYIMLKGESKSHKPAHHAPHHASQQSHHAAHQPAAHHAPKQHPHQPTTQSSMYCSACGTKVHPSFKFCQNCGHRLK